MMGIIIGISSIIAIVSIGVSAGENIKESLITPSDERKIEISFRNDDISVPNPSSTFSDEKINLFKFFSFRMSLKKYLIG